jgi:hypothetical protein
MENRRRVRFSLHALTESMPEREITVVEVLATLAAPEYEFPGNQPNTIESYGRTADGRPFYVVTAKQRSFVITVILVKEPK